MTTTERQPTPLAGKTILVVDDNPAVLKTVADILTFSGYNVLTGKSGEDALRVSGETPGAIDLLLSDVDMPVMSGPVLGQKLKQCRPLIRIMLMSGGGVDGSLLVLNYGWAFIAKPFLFHKLIEMVQEVLSTKDRSQPGGAEFDSRRDVAPKMT